MSAYNACCLYRALKLHFTTEYDYKKYHGKINYSVAQFNKNKHKFVYEKLDKKYQTNLLDFFVSNFLNNDSVWIQELLSQQSNDNWVNYNKRRQSLSYIFEMDLLNIFDDTDHQMVFKTGSGEFPILLTKLLRNEISIETVVIMNKFLNFIPVWEQNIKDDFIWPRIKTKLLKYEPFLYYDKNKFKTLLLNSKK